jgi:ubiquitin C-terminal hydrolase
MIMSGGGLHNLGQTCALNTLIQIISYNSTLRGIILNAMHCSNAPLTHKLGDVINKIYTQKKDVIPRDILRYILSAFPDNFRQHEQMDICELWMIISNRIAEELGVVVKTNEKGIKPLSSGHDVVNPLKIKACVDRFNSNKSSIFLEAIQSINLSIVQCDTCKDTPWNVEVQTTYDIEAPSDGSVVPVSDLLLRTFGIDKLPGWKCDKCSNEGALKQSQVYSLPKVLVISIKRFRMNKSGRFTKIHNSVVIQEVITFEINSKKFNYRLTGIGNHYGSYNGGHYNAHVCLSNGDWLCCDDTIISPVSDTSFMKSSASAYILFYELVC